MKQPRPLMATTVSPGHSVLTSSIRECHRGAGLCFLLCLRPPPPSRVSQPWSLAGRASPMRKKSTEEPEAVLLNINKRVASVCPIRQFLLRPEQQRPAMMTLTVLLWGHALMVKPRKTQILV